MDSGLKQLTFLRTDKVATSDATLRTRGGEVHACRRQRRQGGGTETNITAKKRRQKLKLLTPGIAKLQTGRLTKEVFTDIR